MKIDLNTYIDFSIPEGKKFSDLQAYVSLTLPNEVQEDFCKINHIGCVTSDNEDLLMVIKTDEKHFSLLPGPEFSPRLYRGQTIFYDRCVPALFRQPFTQIKYLTDLLKKYEFCKLMFSHPVLMYLYNWKLSDLSFKVDLDGMAAHYEFGTPFLDVTRSKDVAMFFALCEKNDNNYLPIMDENRTAVLYTVNLNALIKENKSDFHVVGFQALPRPDAQKAYSVIVGYDQNFNDYKSIKYELIKVDRKQSKKYYELFEGGRLLFPKDPIDVWAEEIKKSMEIDSEVLETSYSQKLIPNVWPKFSELIKFLEKFGYRVCEKDLNFSNSEINDIQDAWNKNPPLNFDRVKCGAAPVLTGHLKAGNKL